MKELRPFQIALLAVFGILALVGVFVFANYSGGIGANDRAGKVEVWGTLPKAAVEAGLETLRVQNDHYAEVTYRYISELEMNRTLSDAIAEGAGPDVILISQEELLGEEAKVTPIPFKTLSERTFVDTYLPEFELFLSEHGVYGVPLVLDPLVLYYNRPMLASASIAATPTTWEGVAGLQSAIVVRDAGGTLSRALVPFGAYENVENARAILSLLFLQSGSTITERTATGVKSTIATGDSSFGQVRAESALSYFAQYGDPAKLVYSWNGSLPSSRNAFLAGDLALYPGFASEQPILEAANPNLDFDMAAIPQPATASAKVTYGKAYVLSQLTSGDNQEGALKTILALSGEGPAKEIAKTLSVAPARRVSLVASGSDRYETIYYEEALNAKGWLSPLPSETDNVFSAMIRSMTTGRENARDALKSASQALDVTLR